MLLIVRDSRAMKRQGRLVSSSVEQRGAVCCGVCCVVVCCVGERRKEVIGLHFHFLSFVSVSLQRSWKQNSQHQHPDQRMVTWQSQ